MKVKRKSDSQEFKQQLDVLKSSAWLGNRRKWIPYLFHFSDITNVVSILTSGSLLSRNQARNVDEFKDIASPAIIANTKNAWDYVRLYFRPRTPTLYSNEGFRPKHRHSHNAHCPMPIYLLFDFLSLITLEETLFTNGNLAKTTDVQIYSNAKEFKALPFNDIYHDTWFTSSERDRIIFHRHAEVIIPDRISLDHLQYIWCRSQAEYETLYYLLPPNIWEKWSKRIVESNRLNLFYKKWGYVRQVTLTKEKIIFDFNKAANNIDSGEFEAHIDITENWTGRRYYWEDKKFSIADSFTLNLAGMQQPEDYTVRFTLDGQLAYTNRYQESDLPF